MSKKTEISLLAARAKIDAIDTKIHQLLMNRAELVQNIQTAKASQGAIVNAMHADREIEMFRRFSENHKGCLPIASLQRMFREMIATFSHLQCPFKVFIPKGEPLYRDCARYFYGTIIEIIEYDTVEKMLNAVKDPTSNIALMPANTQNIDKINGSNGCRIFARLPFWDDGQKFGLELPDMFVLGHAPIKVTKHDFSVLAVNQNDKVALENLGYKISEYLENHCIVEGFIDRQDPILQKNGLTWLGVYGKV